MLLTKSHLTNSFLPSAPHSNSASSPRHVKPLPVSTAPRRRLRVSATAVELQSSVIRNLVLLSCFDLRPVLVHDSGPEINSWLLRVGVEPQFHNGLPVTDALTMEVVEMVLVGKVHKHLVSLINLAGDTAVGLYGKDACLITTHRSPNATALGFVGEVTRVDTTVLHPIIVSGHIPVIATVAADETGQAYNINADTAAGKIAAVVAYGR